MLKLELEERFETIEEGLRDTYDNFHAMDRCLHNIEKDLTSGVRVALLLLAILANHL